jgi:hypothetical protein
MIRGSPTLAKVLVGLFCAQHIHVLHPFGACAQNRFRRFCGVPSMAATLCAVVAPFGSLSRDIEYRFWRFY